MCMPTVSVIVPIYNSEKYLKECVESILNQSYRNLEIILVDNGSTDASPSICDEFESDDERVQVIHKKHGSISSGRNAGLNIAKGEYITFLDSDDKMENEMIDVLLKLALDYDSDICVCKSKRMYIDYIENMEETEEKTEYNAQQALYAWQCKRIFGSEVWAKLYKRECVSEVVFPDHPCEDVCYLFESICKSKKLMVIDKRLHYYRMHRTYKERTSFRRPVEDNKIQVMEEILEKVKQNYNEIYRDYFCAFCNSILSSVMKIYAANKTKSQSVFLESAASFFVKNYDAIKNSENISRKNKRMIVMFSFHRKIFGIIFKIRNLVKE